MQTIQLSQIKVKNKWLRLKTDVDDLMDSINQVGLINPLTLNKDYELLAGGRRYQAIKKLGWKKVPVFIFDGEKIQQELASLDENLVRVDLTEADWSEAIARRKELYEMMHPETRQGGDRKSVRIKSSNCQLERFTESTAKKLGVGESTVQRAIKRAEDAAPQVMKAWKEDEIGPVQVDALVRLPKADQVKLLPIMKKTIGLEAADLARTAKEQGVDVAIETAQIIKSGKNEHLKIRGFCSQLSTLLIKIQQKGTFFKGTALYEQISSLAELELAMKDYLSFQTGVKK